MRFDLRYRETLRLPDGRRLRLRVPVAGDRALFRRGFEALSPLSRRRRFLMSKATLSDAELDFLTRPDGETDYAIGALALDWRGRESEPVGVARFSRLPDAPQSAEFAVVVVDAWQGRGVGRRLLRRLLAAAAERGVLTLVGEVMADNAPMLHLLRGVPASCRRRAPGGLIEFRVPVSLAVQSPTPRVAPGAEDG